MAYTYDSLNRLTKADYGGGLKISYTYDAAGNRLGYSDIDTTPYVDTKVVAWGENYDGQTDVPAGLDNVVAVAAGSYHSLALRADGTVVAWGDNTYGQTTVLGGLSNVVAVAAGYGDSLALRSDGTVVAWGYNVYGETTVPSGLTNLVAVAAGYDHSLALRADGTVVAWGRNTYGGTTVPSGLSNVVAVAGGVHYSLALRADGTVVAWGDECCGQTDVPSGLSNVVAVAAGGVHGLALSGDLAPLLKNSLFNQTVVAGASATFRANVTATQPCFYQWQLNGTNLPGATEQSLVLTNLTMSQASSYSVIVSNNFGVVNSSAALTVVPFIITIQPQSQAVALSGTASLSV